MQKFSPPSPLDFTNPAAWDDWKQRFARYRIATKLNTETEEIQVNTLIYAMGPEAESAFRTLQFTDDTEKDKYDIVLKKFDEYFKPKKNVIHERAQFNLRSQRPGESVDAFIRALYDIAETCDFGNNKDELIRDRIVTGLLDKGLSRELQLKSDLTLSVAVQLAKQHETVKAQLSVQSDAGSKSLEELKSRKFGRASKMSSRSAPSPSSHGAAGSSGSSGHRCGRCGYVHNSSVCPAQGKKCRKCHKLNHFASCCKVKRETHELTSESPDTVTDVNSDVYYLNEVRDVRDNTGAWFIDLPVENANVKFKIDPGADVSLMTVDTYRKLPSPSRLKQSDTVLSGVSGAPIECHGSFPVRTTYQGEIYKFDVYVAACRNNLLGRSPSVDMGLISLNLHETIRVKPLNIIKGRSVHIKLSEDNTPYNVPAPRRVPFPLIPKLQAKIDRMLETDVIMPVTEPTDWCAPIVVAPKRHSDDIRVCVDLRRLNRAVKRERYILPTFDDIAAKLKDCTVFSKLDAANAYHQLPLDDESRLLTTFITPMGRFCFKRMPFGISSASEIFQRRMSDMFGDMECVAVNQDDILIGGLDRVDHDARVARVEKILRENNVQLNQPKCERGVKELIFHGHKFSADGIAADPSKVSAVADMPEPTNVTELRRSLGMAKWLGSFVPHLATVLQPLNTLLKSDVEWTWDAPQRKAFQEMKDLLTASPVLAFYDPSLETTVAADASSYGLGAVLLQSHDGRLKPVAYASRSLTECERRYAQIEKECLGLVWACEKFNRYLVGLPIVHLLTDHKPLIPLINNKDLDLVPIRCQRLLIRLMRFNCHAEYTPGKTLVVPDALSRSPLSVEEVDVCEVEEYSSYVPVSDVIVQQLQRDTASDSEMQAAISYTITGWPKYARDVPSELKPYFNERAYLSVAQGLLLYCNRIVVPRASRQQILGKLHNGHMGISKCRSRAEQTVWWPGISSEIKALVASCSFCQEHRPSQRHEPMISTPLPDGPWLHIGADLLTYEGNDYIVITDYYSRWMELIYMGRDTTAKSAVNKFKNVFSRWGIPQKCTTDNGPQFSSNEFKQFAESYGFVSTTSSPRYPQSNGAAEKSVDIAKHILAQDNPMEALMEYRATPTAPTGFSPAKLMMGRNIRTRLPMTDRHLRPEWPSHDSVRMSDEAHKNRNKHYYDLRHGVRPLPELHPGDTVRVKDDSQKKWDETATVIGPAGTPRSYQVQTPRGVLRRNRRHLSLVPESSVRKPLPVMTVPAVPESHEMNLPDETPIKVNSAACEPPPRPPDPKPFDPGATYTRSGRQVVQPNKLTL